MRILTAAVILAAATATSAFAQERLTDLYDSAKEKVTEGARRTDEAIRAHPYESLAIALGVGVLIGAGILSIQWNKDGSATIHFDKEKARERSQQALEGAKKVEARIEDNIKNKSAAH